MIISLFYHKVITLVRRSKDGCKPTMLLFSYRYCIRGSSGWNFLPIYLSNSLWGGPTESRSKRPIWLIILQQIWQVLFLPRTVSCHKVANRRWCRWTRCLPYYWFLVLWAKILQEGGSSMFQHLGMSIRCLSTIYSLACWFRSPLSLSYLREIRCSQAWGHSVLLFIFARASISLRWLFVWWFL